MYKKNKIALVIPAYNEEKLIIPTLTHVPKTIDRVYVVDDCSTDNMAEVVRGLMKKDKRIRLVSHRRNQGPGGGIITGYKLALKDGYDIAVVIGGDYQMDLVDLPNFLDPLINKEADYTKGNRFIEEATALKFMPAQRLFGNSMLSLLTKIASGYYKIFDTMDGYTGMTKEAIKRVDWRCAWKGYGYPANFLIVFNAFGLKVLDVPRRAIYIKGERQTQIKTLKYIMKVAPMMFRGFFWRLIKKYVMRDFHPLVFFYFMGMLLIPIGIIWGLKILFQAMSGAISGNQVVLVALFLIMGFQSLLFAMFFDMEESK